MKEEVKDGDFGVNTRDKCRNNFEQLYQVTPLAISRIMSKLRAKEVYKDLALDDDYVRKPIIRISLWGDSIYTTRLVDNIETKFKNLFPGRTFEFRNAIRGGTGANYHAALMWDVINFNPDLIIIEEWETFRLAEEMDNFFRLLKQKTSTDILVNPFPIAQSALDLLIAGNIKGYKSTDSYNRREWFYAMVGKYGCGMFDPNQLLVNDIIQGRVKESDTWMYDEIHTSEDYENIYFMGLFEQFFSPLHQNEYQSLSTSEWFKTIYFRNELSMPDIKEGDFSTGDWVINTVNTDVSYSVAETSTASATWIGKINGIGFEIAHFGGAVGVFSVEISSDGGATYSNPSDLLKDYATSANNILTGLHKIIVDTNILSNDETERKFTLTMDSDTGYTLVDTTNSTTIGTGVITNDEVFTINSGQITIPANYAESNNWRGTVLTGQVYTFSIKKNWYDTIDIAADSLTKVTRIFGLERGDYTVKLTRVSGTVNLDSIMELK